VLWLVLLNGKIQHGPELDEGDDGETVPERRHDIGMADA
jgi:hypothetical protein